MLIIGRKNVFLSAVAPPLVWNSLELCSSCDHIQKLKISQLPNKPESRMIWMIHPGFGLSCCAHHTVLLFLSNNCEVYEPWKC